MKLLNGTGVALVTPMNADGTLDLISLRRLVRHVSPTDYLVVMGTTGESATLADSEKDTILNEVLRLNKSSKPVVFGIGGNNTAAVVSRLQNWNPPKGVVAVLSVVPYYNKPSQEGLYRHFVAVAEASPLPVLLYNVPGRTGQNLNADTVIRLAGHRQIIGIKEASGNLEQCLRIRQGTPEKFMLISGDDMLTSAIMSIGGAGGISVLANAFPKRFRKITDLCSKGRYPAAAKEIAKLSDLNPLMYEEGNPTGIKEVLGKLGIIQNNMRLPMVTASAALSDRISKTILSLKG